ncbi:MAG: disulfide bond formation protein B [Acidimicrobiia bacterium]|jgi:disulfide bond formation protein DsbB
MNDVDVANTFFTILTLLANAVVVVAVLLALAALVSGSARRFAGSAVDAVGPSARLLAWFVATVATLGSLYYSEIAHFVPCRLCWYQRICMYPLAAILLVGLVLRDHRARIYAAPFVVVGAPLSLYHWLVERGVFTESKSCSATVPCSVPWFEELGYVTLAFMAMSGFLLIGTLLLVDWISERRSEGAAGVGTGNHWGPGDDHSDGAAANEPGVPAVEGTT